LENVVTRAVVLCHSRAIGVDDLPAGLSRVATGEPAWEGTGKQPLRKAMEEPERAILEAALRENGWNRQATARQLGINRTTLYKKMKRFGLRSEPARTR
jgi:DNA-binding NtrC family response regulator